MEPDKSDGWCWRSMREGAELDASPDADWTFFEPIKNFLEKRRSLLPLLDDPRELYRREL